MDNIAERSQAKQKKNLQLSQQYDPKMEADVYLVKIPSQGIAQRIYQSFKEAYIPGSNQRIKIFESFIDRGKCKQIKYDFDANEKLLVIRVEKKYYLNVLKMHEYQMLKIIQGFNDLWKNCYLNTIKSCLKIFNDSKRQAIKNWDLIAIDIIGITFDLVINNRRRFRFRISYFQFRNDLGFYVRDPFDNYYKNPRLYMQSHQLISYSDPNFYHPNQFYRSPRLSFLQQFKIIDRFYFYKISQKFQIFYLAYTLCKPVTLHQYYQFNRKALPGIIFTSNRFKSFQLMFVFQHLHQKLRNIQQQKKQRNQIDKYEPEMFATQNKIGLSFLMDDLDDSQIKKRDEREIQLCIIDYDNFLNPPFSPFRFQYSKQFLRKINVCFFDKNQTTDIRYLTYLKKKIKLFQDKISHKNPSIRGQRQKPQQKFQKFLANLASMVSFMLDRLCFSPLYKYEVISQESVTIQLSTELNRIPKYVYDEMQQKYKYQHHFIILIKSQYYKQGSKPPFGHLYNLDQNKFYKVIRKTDKINTREENKNRQQKKKQRESSEKDIQLHEIFKHYIDQMLRFYSLREGYSEIISFVHSLIQVVYADPTTQVQMQKIYRGNRQTLLAKVIRALTHQTDFVKLKIFPNPKAKKNLKNHQQTLKVPFVTVTYSIYDYRYGITSPPKQIQGDRMIRIYDNKVQLDRGGIANTVQIAFYDKKNDQADFFSEENLREALKVTTTDFQ